MYEDRLEGFSNYSPWKEKIKLVLQVNRLWEFIKKEIKKPTDPKDMEIYEDFNARMRLIILDGVRDAIISHFSGKNIAHEMCMALQNLFQNKNENQVLVLEDKLNSTKMINGESVTSYLTRLSQVKAKPTAIGVFTLDGDMARIALNGFTDG